VFNLFALAAYHIAEHLGVPCVAVSPWLILSSPPHWFASRFKRQHKQRYSALQTDATAAAASSNSSSERKSDDSNRLSESVSWSDVEHWMWPLFAEDEGWV